MNVHKLDSIFKPERIVVVGANENPKTVGYTVLHNLIGGGFRGVVHPVHPGREMVQGIPAYPDLNSLPHTPDLAVICKPAAQVPDIIRNCGEAGIRGIIVISAGFKEAGSQGEMLEQRIREHVHHFDGMSVIGPNCLGVIVPRLGLNASFAHCMPALGRIAFISQSGALCTSVLDWAIEKNMGFSHLVSVGNMVDVGFADLIDYFGENQECDAIMLYMESLTNARKFMTVARAYARSKPILVYKAGRFAESAKAADSHTGAMAGEDVVYQAAFERAGIVRVHEIDDFFDCAELVSRHEPPLGGRLAIVSNAGGPAVMATDALMSRDGHLAQLSEVTLAELDACLPRPWSHGNPVDVLGDSGPKRTLKAVEIVLKDPGVDAVLVIVTPQAMTKPSTTAEGLIELNARSKKPILAAWLGGVSVREGIGLLGAAGIPTYATPERAVRALMTLVDYVRNLESLTELPHDVPGKSFINRGKFREGFLSISPQWGKLLPEHISKQVLASYGIPVTEARPAHDADEAAVVARDLGYPVVLKVLSPQVTHKTDVGGVAIDLCGDDAVREAFDRIVSQAKASLPNALIAGVTVQKMVRAADGHELIVGAKRDATFGSVIMVGTGGVAAEVFEDRCVGLSPLNERLARHMLESLRSWPLLRGHRGRPGVDIEALIEVIMRFSHLVVDCPEIETVEMNPLLVSPHSITALDARIVIDLNLVGNPPERPFPGLPRDNLRSRTDAPQHEVR